MTDSSPVVFIQEIPAKRHGSREKERKVRWVGRKRREDLVFAPSPFPSSSGHSPRALPYATRRRLGTSQKSEPAKSSQLGDRLNASSEKFESSCSWKGRREVFKSTFKLLYFFVILFYLLRGLY